MTDFSRITRGIRTGIESDTGQGSVVPPIYLSTNYTFTGLGEPRDFDYSRSRNPTRAVLAEALATLEGGAGAVVTASGMGAVNTTVQALLGPEDTVVIPHDCYGGTWRLFDAYDRKGLCRVVTVDFTDLDQVRAALADRPTLVWVETPSNPLLRLTDLAEVGRLAHEVGALVLADNTFLSPILQRPIEHGADLVLHSTTKYINGHSDVIGGAVISSTSELHEQLTWWANTIGVTGGAFDSYLTIRGLRTLHTRIQAHEENAAAVVPLLADHDAVRVVHHPSLSDHPGHEIAVRQQDGFGSIVSLELHGGRPAVAAFAQALECFSLAESLGG
ncbi:MAG: PLP-dependent transferase, partial [Propionibacteriales bacterium]|nr:PLP-dependent transferase [Propionibacteriales bacterium]